MFSNLVCFKYILGLLSYVLTLCGCLPLWSLLLTANFENFCFLQFLVYVWTAWDWCADTFCKTKCLSQDYKKMLCKWVAMRSEKSFRFCLFTRVRVISVCMLNEMYNSKWPQAFKIEQLLWKPVSQCTVGAFFQLDSLGL